MSNIRITVSFLFHPFLILSLCVTAFDSSLYSQWKPGDDILNEADLKEAIAAINKKEPGTDEVRFAKSHTITYKQLYSPLNADTVLTPVDYSFTVDGNGGTLEATGDDPFPGFFVRGGDPAIVVTIKNPKIKNAHAKGGDGGVINNKTYGGAGGGGMGAGGGLFVHEGANVVLENMTFSSCQATGGTGGAQTDSKKSSVGGGVVVVVVV